MFFLDEWSNKLPFIECRTSGSTGEPKLIRLPKQLMAESAMRTVRHFGLDGNSHLHSCISTDFIGGKMMVVRAALMGAKLTSETPSNRPLRDYDGPEIDLLAVVPSQMIDLLDRLDQLPKIRHIIIGGAPIPPDLRGRIARSGLDAWETYGMTETASHIALRRVTDPPLPFRPLDGICIHCDADNRLIIEMGQWGKFHTNDIVEIGEDNSFTIKGRADNVIITGGKKVHPEEVEAILEGRLGCEVMVTSEPDTKWGRRVVLILSGHIRTRRDLQRSPASGMCAQRNTRTGNTQDFQRQEKRR